MRLWLAELDRYGRHALVLLALGAAAALCCGCATAGSGPLTSRTEFGAAGPRQVIEAAELDELTRAFADRYVGLLASACDALKKDNPDPVQRREAQELLSNCAANVYDIASNADAFTRLLDLVVVTTLVSQVWIDDDRAGEVFGERGEVLVRALHHGRVEAWALAGQVLRPEQLDLLDYTIWDWRRHNPDMVRAPFVRFSNFAIGRGKSATAEVLAAGGFFAKVEQAGQAVDEARLVTERMFFQFKRQPTLLRWELETLKDNFFATPGVGTYLADIHRLTQQAEQLPAHVAAERQAILTAVDERMRRTDETVAHVRAALNEADGLVASIGPTSESLNEMLKSANTLFARFDTSARSPATQPARPFDVREYTHGVQELAGAVERMNELLKSSNELLVSSEWGARIEQVNDSADGRMAVASEQGQLVVREIFRRVYLALGLTFVLLVLYRLISYRLARRLSVVTAPTDPPRQADNGEPLPTCAIEDRPKLSLRSTNVLLLVALSLPCILATGCSLLSLSASRAAHTNGNVDVAPAAEETASADPTSDVLPAYDTVAGLTGKINSIGASTTTNLVARAAVEFRRIYPGVTVQASAGLTSIGPPALLAGRAHIVPMSRALTGEEVAAFVKKYGYPPTEIKVAADALAIYVEQRNPLPGLTLEQLDGIFSRTHRRGGTSINTWGQTGLTGDWADRPIALYGYGPGDGVHQIFRQQVMNGGEYRISMHFEPAGSSIVQGIAANPDGIGCASTFFVSKRVRAVPLAGTDGRFYAPTAENVRSHTYPLSQFHYIYVNKHPRRPLTGPAVEFLRFLLSREGQQIAAAGGNIPLDAATVEQGRLALTSRQPAPHTVK